MKLPRAPADIRTIASVNGMLPIVLGLILAWRQLGTFIDAFLPTGAGAPAAPESGPLEIHLIWFALGAVAVLTSPLLYHGWDVGRLVTVALGLTAIALAIVELAAFAVRWPVIVCGLIWPAFVVVYLLRRGKTPRAQDAEPPFP